MKRIARALLDLLPSPAHPLCRGPGPHLRWRYGWLKTQSYYRPRLALAAFFGGTRVRLGRGACVQGRLEVRGPGTVLIGADTILDGHVTLFTHDPAARLSIGPRCFVNGTRFGCVRSITVGAGCILGDARLMDTDFHSVAKDRNSRAAFIATAPVTIGNNVWLAAGAGVLKGVTIGDDAVLAFQAVATGNVPAGRIYGGNPARDLGPVPESSGS